MAKTMKLAELKKQYAFICNEWVAKFCNKQGFEFEGWVGDVVGSGVFCSDIWFSLQDIILDIETKQPKGAILEWHDGNLENPEKAINYSSYVKGLRVEAVNPF